MDFLNYINSNGYRFPISSGNMPYINNYANFEQDKIYIKDFGKKPTVIDIEQATKQNNNYRIALWTGEHLQVTLMSIPVGGNIGLEVHPNIDQFIRIEQGIGLVQMGDAKDNLDFYTRAGDGYAVMVPAGKWHNITNIGNVPLKLYSIYAPPDHQKGVVEKTKQDAEHEV